MLESWARSSTTCPWQMPPGQAAGSAGVAAEQTRKQIVPAARARKTQALVKKRP
jgi:hypothetical protein